jgi:23S rRNA (cytosine1962-C5)-methyltransferase
VFSSTTSGYQLLDFGRSRKLEAIGGKVVDRPAPAATGPVSDPDLWQRADLRFDLSTKRWQSVHGERVGEWVCEVGRIRMGIKPTPAGQLGVFPEHWQHWPWLNDCLEPPNPDRSWNVLNLFAYSGATTLALAAAGHSVTHVDASQPMVQWARQNASLSGLSDRPIRWIVDDAMGFLRRELKRGRTYDAIVLDPPTFGHGKRGERWEIERDLPDLMLACWRLLSENRRCVLMSGHSTGIDLRRLHSYLKQHSGSKEAGSLSISQNALVDRNGRKLDCGYVCKFTFND